MSSVLENVSHVAVWGSLVSSTILGSYLFVQACTDAIRRWRYAIFALVCALVALLDFYHGEFSFLLYEKLRIIVWSAWAGAILNVLGLSLILCCAATVALPIIGLSVWRLLGPDLATTSVVPTAFTISAIAFFYQYSKTKGYASCVLAVFSTVLAQMCYTYYWVISTGNSDVIGIGYLHYAVMSACSILFGWVNLPRELRGMNPVKVQPIHALAFAVAVIGGELGVRASTLLFFQWPPYWFLFFVVLQFTALLVLFFHHRHQLVIYTDNVTALLEERTASLREAQLELARQNEIQKEKLIEQEKELQLKAKVIERQRRLELAAQTAGQAAHDIQNLISPMLSQLNRLEKEAGKASPQEVVKTLRKQTDELLELNGQLLTLARRGRVENNPICLKELVAELAIKFPDGCVRQHTLGDGWISGSWSQLSRAVSNLIVNALDAIDEYGARKPEVQVTSGLVDVTGTRRCHLGFLNPGRYGFIRVEDFSTGIPEEFLEKIFEPFFSSKDGKGNSGSGLGLTIVAAVMDDHGGVLDLTTGREGTAFSLFFPAIEPPGHIQEESLEKGEGTVLLVDDDNAILSQYERFLMDAGYDVLTAEDGNEALRLLQAEQVDLILLDLNMPRRSGYETFFAALHIRPGIKAVVHSSYVTDAERTRLLELGVAAIIQKPASKREILGAIREHKRNFAAN